MRQVRPDSDQDLREVMSHFPAAVVAITSVDGERALGLTVSSFVSVSLRPHLVAFCAGRSSRSWADIESTGRFCVNLLADDQAEVGRSLAGPGPDKFASVPWSLSPGGLPLIRGTVAWLECRLDGVRGEGDHWLVTGRVERHAVGAERRPLVFHRRSYRTTSENLDR